MEVNYNTLLSTRLGLPPCRIGWWPSVHFFIPRISFSHGEREKDARSNNGVSIAATTSAPPPTAAPNAESRPNPPRSHPRRSHRMTMALCPASFSPLRSLPRTLRQTNSGINPGCRWFFYGPPSSLFHTPIGGETVERTVVRFRLGSPRREIGIEAAAIESFGRTAVNCFQFRRVATSRKSYFRFR